MLILGKNIYINNDNVSMFGKESYPKDVLNTLLSTYIVL